MARRKTSALAPFLTGDDVAQTFWSPHFPPDYLDPNFSNKRFVFAFAIVTDRLFNGQPFPNETFGFNATVAVGTGSSIGVTAYYVWDFDNGAGGHGGYFDAFNVDLGDFIPDDFVDVSPDEGGTRTPDANNGWLASDELPAGLTLKIVARTRPTKPFYLGAHTSFTYTYRNWTEVAVLTSGDPRPAIAQAERSVSFHRGNIVAAIAMYSGLPRLSVPEFERELPNFPVDLWGPIPPFFAPIDPSTAPASNLAAVVRLLEAAKLVGPAARAELMRVAEKEAQAVLDAIRKQTKEK